MATIAEFTIPARSFPLGRIFEDFPAVEVELERVIPTSGAIIPYFWVRGLTGGEVEDLETALADEPNVKEIRRIDEVKGNYLNRIEWAPEHDGILRAITETDVVILSGVGSAKEWMFELRADERKAVSAFQQYCLDNDLPVTLQALHSLAQMETGAEYDLTEAQREALVLAYQRGYYQTPREVSLDEMALEFGITGQSLGSRLRRGTHRLIGSTLIGS